MNKYRAKRIKSEDGNFDSTGEFKRWCVLKLAEQAGLIQSLERQVRFKLAVYGTHICDYIADYTYYKNGIYVVEDFKGIQTKVFKLKKKLMRAVHGIDIKVVNHAGDAV